MKPDTRKETMSTIRTLTAEAWRRGEQFRESEVAQGLPANPSIRLGQYLGDAIGWSELLDTLGDLIEVAPTDKSVNLILEGFTIAYRDAVKKEQVTA